MIGETMRYDHKDLYDSIESARRSFIDSVSNLSNRQVIFKPSEKEWSILEITEHMVWAEQIGICGMFSAIEGIKSGNPIWSGASFNQGLTIEEIVEKTWRPKEIVPKVAEPRWGGSIDFWICGLKNNSHLLNELKKKANSLDLTLTIYPHPISGPMNVIQRLQFLRFHLERHERQVAGLKSKKNYPK